MPVCPFLKFRVCGWLMPVQLLVFCSLYNQSMWWMQHRSKTVWHLHGGEKSTFKKKERKKPGLKNEVSWTTRDFSTMLANGNVIKAKQTHYEHFSVLTVHTPTPVPIIYTVSCKATSRQEWWSYLYQQLRSVFTNVARHKTCSCFNYFWWRYWFSLTLEMLTINFLPLLFEFLVNCMNWPDHTPFDRILFGIGDKRGGRGQPIILPVSRHHIPCFVNEIHRIKSCMLICSALLPAFRVEQQLHNCNGLERIKNTKPKVITGTFTSLLYLWKCIILTPTIFLPVIIQLGVAYWIIAYETL